MSAAPPTTRRKPVAKKKKHSEEQSTIYARIPASLKQLFESIAEAHGRKLNSELVYALRDWCERHKGDVPPAVAPQEGK